MTRKREVKILLYDEEGKRHDVTFATQIIYDALHGSMDFGSGMLDSEEELAMSRLARLAGWTEPLFPHDRCSACNHEWADHNNGGCFSQVQTVPPTYERKLLTRTQMRPISDEEALSLRMQLEAADSKEDMRAILRAASTETRTETIEYEGTVMVDPGETEKCSCSGFKRD